ncbi:hypothetical protein [Fimbriiglobus ruber]|uniref:hypothetical protein n=1 Tax=Fimbriiglobus ruber TaxID=1908690 RepID=UPI00117A46F0|nr:hypothetical protein [Fimbriiglobus ruber]
MSVDTIIAVDLGRHNVFASRLKFPLVTRPTNHFAGVIFEAQQIPLEEEVGGEFLPKALATRQIRIVARLAAV